MKLHIRPSAKAVLGDWAILRFSGVHGQTGSSGLGQSGAIEYPEWCPKTYVDLFMFRATNERRGYCVCFSELVNQGRRFSRGELSDMLDPRGWDPGIPRSAFMGFVADLDKDLERKFRMFY